MVSLMIKNLSQEKFFYKLNFFLMCLVPLSIVSPSLILNLFVVVISFVYITTLIYENDYKLIKNKFFIFIIVFFIYLIINLNNSILVLESVPRTFGFLRFILFSFAIAYVLSFKDFKYFKIIIISWFILFFFISLDLLYEFIFGKNVFGYSNNFSGRLSGVLNDELKIGGYYYGFICISIATIFYLTKKSYAFFIIPFFMFIAIVIGERANLIKITFSLIIFFSFMREISIKKKLFILFTFIIGIFIIISANSNLKNRFSTQFLKYIADEGISSYYFNSQYGAHFDSANKIIKKNLFFGVGLKNFPYECVKKEYLDKKFYFHKSRCTNHPHQTHLDILVSVGLLGYIILMISLLYLLIKNIFIFYKTKNLFTLAGIAFLTTTLFLPLPAGSFFSSYGATIFWLNIGLILAFEKIKI